MCLVQEMTIPWCNMAATWSSSVKGSITTFSKDGPVVDCKRYPDRCTYYNDIWTIDLPQTKFELTEDPVLVANENHRS